MEKRFSVNLRHRLLLLVSAKCLRALLAAFDGPWKLKFQRTAGWAASSRFLMASLRYRVCHVGQLLPGLGDDEAVLAGDVDGPGPGGRMGHVKDGKHLNKYFRRAGLV